MNINHLKLFEQLVKSHEESKTLQHDGSILIVDFLNTFFRAFAASPAMNSNGDHVGGITGFLYSLGNAIKMSGATKCIIVMDGEGGSLRKRKLYPEYKMKRKVRMNINRTYYFRTPDEEIQSMKKQTERLLQYLECMPITNVCISNVEADDIICYIAKEVFNKPENKITILSSDKDFLQIVDDRISVWSPTKKKMYTPELVKEDYGISSTNFLLYRMLDGDKSDNIPGIKGVGLKTIHKYLPILSEDTKKTTKELIDYTKEMQTKNTKLKFYSAILENEKILLLNEKLMQLESPSISAQAKMKVTELVTKEAPAMHKYRILQMYVLDGISSAIPNISDWLFTTFSVINSFSKKDVTQEITNESKS